MSIVWLCEKPKMGAALANALGTTNRANGSIETRDGVVTWAVGHLLSEKEPDEIDPVYAKWSIDALPLCLDDIPLKPSPDLAAQLAAIGRLLRKADEVVIATDADRAGERIGREIIEHFGFEGRVRRLLLRSPEASDIRDAIKEMRADPKSAERTHPWLYEERGRAFEDWHIGMNGTRAGTVKLRPPEAFEQPWSVGGVQTPTLALIVDRDRTIEDFKSRDFYTIEATVETPKGRLTLKHEPDPRIFDRALADRIKATVERWDGALNVDKKVDTVRPPLLYGQTSLQRAAGKAFGWAPAKTLKVAQRLYEGGYITYPRGDCEYIGTSSMPKIERALEQLARAPGFEALKAHLATGKPEFRMGLRYNDEKVKRSAHEAIVPTASVPNLNELPSDERALYLMLARNLAANHMPDGLDNTAKVHFSVDVDDAPRAFALTGRQRVREGWRALMPPDKDARPIPAAEQGDKARTVETDVAQGKTEPPKRWALWDLPTVMARLEEFIKDQPLSDNEKKALVAALQTDNPEEPRGLGTPATRASIISILVKRNYVEVIDSKGVALSADQVKAMLEDKAGKKPKAGAKGEEAGGKGGKKQTYVVRATPNGRALIKAWREAYPRLADPVERARMEDELRAIGRAGNVETATKLYGGFKRRVHSDVKALVDAARNASRAEFSAEDRAKLRPVSKKQTAYAKALAKWRGVALDEQTAGDAGRLSAFIDAHKPKEGETFVSPKQIDLALTIVEIMKTGDDPKQVRKDPARVVQLIEENPPATWPPTKGQIGAVEKIAQRNGIELPENWRSDGAFIRKVLDDNPYDKKAAKAASAAPPSEKSLAYAKVLASKLKIDIEPDAFATQAAVSAFIEKHASHGDGGRSPRSGGRGR